MKILGAVDKGATLKKTAEKKQREMERWQLKALQEEKKFADLKQEHNRKVLKLQNDFEAERAAIHREKTTLLNELAALEAQNEATAEALGPLFERFEENTALLEVEKTEVNKLLKEAKKKMAEAQKLFEASSKMRERAENVLLDLTSLVTAGKDVKKRADNDISIVFNTLENAREMLDDLQNIQERMEKRLSSQESEISNQMIWIMDRKAELLAKEDELRVKSQRLRATRDLIRKKYGNA